MAIPSNSTNADGLRNNGSGLQRWADRFTAFSRAVVPDPMVFAALLTVAVLAIAAMWPTTPELGDADLWARSRRLSDIWFDGLWQTGLLAFALQMCLILLAGFGVATSPLIGRGLDRLAARPRSAASAACLVAAVSCLGCWLNWGFGLVASGLLATAIRRRFGEEKRGGGAMLVAAAYSGMMIWHGGFSGSAPLKVARDGVVLESAGAAGKSLTIGVDQTILSSGNLILTFIFFVGIPLLFYLMSGGRNGSTQSSSDASSEFKNLGGDSLTSQTGNRATADVNERDAATGGPAEWLNRRRMVSAVLGSLAIATVIWRLIRGGAGAVDLNFVNTAFLGLGLLLHRSVADYLAAIASGGKAIVGIVILFPFYAGIQGLMKDTELSAQMTQAFIDSAAWVASATGISPAYTFTPACFFSAAVVNLFVPSGGGQWIVQGPMMCGAAEGLGVSIPQTIMAISYGDQWTNMIQPFWAIPLMGLTGVRPREFLGACILLMLLSGPIFVFGLMFLY